MPVTQFNMKWVEPAGLVKFDFLGLKTLTVLDHAVKLVRRRGIDIDLSRIPLDDAKTYEMLARGETVGIFQVESQGMRRALIDMRPDRFEDLIVLVALYRPGPMANIPTYCARKLGHEPHRLPASQARSRSCRRPTASSPIRSRCSRSRAISPATVSARPTSCAAPWARRTGRRWRRSATVSCPARSSAASRKADAEAIFEACAKFAEYGFNKSHSAPYALLTYQTAYMKANYPVEFLAASMTLEMGNTDKLAEFRAEASGSASRSSRRRSTAPASSSTSRATPSIMRLRRCAASAGRQSKALSRRAARRPFAESHRFRPPHQPARAQQARAGKPHRCRRLRRHGGQPRPHLRRRRYASGGGAAHARRCRARPIRTVRRAGIGRAGRFAGASSRGCRPSGCNANTRRSVFSSPAIRSTITPRRCQAAARAVLGRVLARGQSRRRRRTGRRHGDRAHRAAHQDRKQDGDHRAVRRQRPL